MHRLGIATHAFVDTWAHQNFTGSWNDFNDMGNAITPDVGHADALHHPDWVSHRWNDDRLVDSNINNNTRFIAAARRLYYTYSEFLNSIGKAAPDTWNAQESLLLGILGPTYSGDSEKGGADRTEQYKNQAQFLSDYDDGMWQSAALDVKTVPKPGCDEYVERYFWKAGVNRTATDWFKFQEAIKAHTLAGKNILQHVFAVAGITA